MQVRRRQLNPDPIMLIVLTVQLFENQEVILERHALFVQAGPQCRSQGLRQVTENCPLGFIRQGILLANFVGIGDPHPDVIIGLQHAPCRFHTAFGLPGNHAVNVLDGGDARLDHLERRMERVQIGVHIPCPHPGDPPQLQGLVKRSELQWRQTDVVMCIDEARQDNMVERPEHLVGLVPGRNVGERADVDDRTVTLKDRAVVDHIRLMAPRYLADDVSAANDGG